MHSNSYPIMLNIAQKHCLVIGGGLVATRKVKGLLEAAAFITIISPEITEDLRKLVEQAESTVRWTQRVYVVGELAKHQWQQTEQTDVFQMRPVLVFAATADETVNQQIVVDCAHAGLLVNSVNQPEIGDFVLPANLRRGRLTISVSASGASPMLTQQIRDQLATQFGPEYEEWLEFLNEFRAYTLVNIDDEAKRRELLAKVLKFDVLTSIREGQASEKKAEIWQQCFANDEIK
jgi:precorrin-2 dehydrogenase/sirohydrochlorin ferrochelatase